MATKTFETKLGRISVRNAMLEERDGTTLCEGLEIKDDFDNLIVDIPEGVNHTFENQVKGITVFYGRDRGETNVQAKSHANRKTFLRSDVESYGYLLTKEGNWLMVNGNQNSRTRDYIELEEVLRDDRVSS